MDKRVSLYDRRQKNIKGFAPDKRQEVRRDEDRSDDKAYFYALFLSFSTLLIFFIISIAKYMNEGV